MALPPDERESFQRSSGTIAMALPPDVRGKFSKE
jgi:hypothetical protein